MELRSLLNEDLILAGLTSNEKFDVITELVDFLINKGTLQSVYREQALQALREREESMSTGMGEGVALPHATVDFLSEVVCALGIHHSGVDFDSSDNLPAHVIILMLVPIDRFREHVAALAGISRLMHTGRLKGRLRKSQSPREAMNIILEEEPSQ